MDFSDLLGGDDWTRFLACYRAKRMHVCESPARDRFGSLWADWELDAICRFTPLTEVDRFRLVRDAKKVPPAAFRDRIGRVRADAVRQLYAGGVSVTLANLEYYSDPVLSLRRSLERALDCRLKFSFYATPTASQALGAHRDEHDVLVLQLHGMKSWEIYHDPEEPAREAEVPQRYTLRSGSWLYVPKNMRHEVKNEGAEPSIHLTVGFHPLTWGAVLQNALERANAASPLLNEPVSRSPDAADDPARLAERLMAVIPFVDAAAQRAGYFGDAAESVAAVPEPIARGALEAMTDATPLIWRSAEVHLRPVSGALTIEAAYRPVPLDLRPELEPALSRMAAGAAFRPADLGLSEPGVAVLLCKFLAQTGVLRIAD